VLWPPWWAPADHDAPLTGALCQVSTRQTLPLALPCVSCGPYRYRSLSLNPRRARPQATTRAIQLAHIGTDQSPMMTVHSIKIRTPWNSATTAKITPAHVPSSQGAVVANVERTIWLPYPESNISGHPARARHHRALPRVTGWRGPNASFEAPSPMQSTGPRSSRSERAPF